MNKQCFIMKNNIYLIWIISEQLSLHIVIVGVFTIALYLLLLF